MAEEHVRVNMSYTRYRLAAATSVSVAVVATMLSVPAESAGTACEELRSLTLEHTTITLAEQVVAGGFSSPPAGRSQATQAVTTRIPFCRVAATLTPTTDSDIKIEVWLPTADWNGKLQAVGNGGWAGAISYAAMNDALNRGYATTSTDTGHSGVSASFAVGHPEKLNDYAYRSEHEMAVAAKTIVTAFFGTAPKRAYFNGCSTGGRQAIVEAARYPTDFDGIIAGAAANPKTHLDAWRITSAQTMFHDPNGTIPPDKLPMLHRAVLDACDGGDGLKDGLLTDPRQCRFDPSTIECKGNEQPSCLAPAQVSVVRALMSPLRHRTTGEEIFPGFEPGTELGWREFLGGPGPIEPALDQYKFIVFGDPNWDWRTFDAERDVVIADRIGHDTLAAVSHDLSAFASRGGKLLMYHGWSDQAIAPGASINYYTKALATTNVGTSDKPFVQLFMVPGMGHCRGGEGPDTFDVVTALEEWVEGGVAPERIVASRTTSGRVDRSRPLCPYPQVARYRGTGSIDHADNFVCGIP